MKLHPGLLLTVMSLFPSLCIGQCEKANIDSASIDPQSKRVSVGFNWPMETAGTANIIWTVLDGTSQKAIPIKSSVEYHAENNSKISSAAFNLEKTDSVDVTHKYFITALNLNFGACKPKAPTTAFSELKVVGTGDKTPQPSSSVLGFTFGKAKGRDDSDLYLSGLIDGADGQKASYTADIKFQVQVPLNGNSEENAYGNRVSKGWWLVPSYDFKASTNPKSDGNSVTAALALTRGFKLPSTWVTLSEIAPAFLVESDKQYKAINNLFRLREDFVVRVVGSGMLQFYSQVFLGLETGGNARSPVAGAFPGQITRPLTGVHAYLNLFHSTKPGRIAFIESEYIRRWPLLSEPQFSQDKSGNLHLTSIGTNPRDYVWAKFEYDFTDYFGLTLGYDYGKLPPVYTKVDNKYSIGLVAKSGLKYKPK